MQRYRIGFMLWNAAWLLALVLIATCVSGLRCSAQGAAPAYYRNDEFHYRFIPPTGWDRKTDMPKLTTAFLGPDESNFTVNLTVTVYTAPVKDEDLEKFAIGLKIDHGQITERVKTKLGGKPAWMWRTKLNIPGHPAAENRQVVCIYKNRGYELTMTVPAGFMRSKYDAVFDQWIASFVWMPTAAAPFRDR